jgi:hypothetical protein
MRCRLLHREFGRSRSPGPVRSPWEIAIAELRRAAGDDFPSEAPH